jgi:hypothetical protein
MIRNMASIEGLKSSSQNLSKQSKNKITCNTSIVTDPVDGQQYLHYECQLVKVRKDRKITSGGRDTLV